MLQQEGPAPYTTPSAVTTVIDRVRNGSLPQVIDASALTRLGVQDSLTARTIASLKLLDLIDADGKLTDTAVSFARATSDEFKPAVADWLRSLYGEVFQILGEPADADFKRVDDAFRHYQPAGQRGRMVTLFIGLLDYAGVLHEDSQLKSSMRSLRKSSRPASPGPRKPRSESAKSGAEKPAPDDQGSRQMSKGEILAALKHPGLHPFVEGLIQTLPPVGAAWSAAKREAWLTAARASFDVIYELPSDEASG